MIAIKAIDLPHQRIEALSPLAWEVIATETAPAGVDPAATIVVATIVAVQTEATGQLAETATEIGLEIILGPRIKVLVSKRVSNRPSRLRQLPMRCKLEKSLCDLFLICCNS